MQLDNTVGGTLTLGAPRFSLAAPSLLWVGLSRAEILYPLRIPTIRNMRSRLVDKLIKGSGDDDEDFHFVEVSSVLVVLWD